jgi:hypothetical protein
MAGTSVFLVVTVGLTVATQARDCHLGDAGRYTDDFYFSATSASGAVGDVVAIDVGLTVEANHGALCSLAALATFDASRLELIGEPVLSNEAAALTYLTIFGLLGDDPGESPSGAVGFVLGLSLFCDAATELFGESESVPIATLYFRVHGTPGAVADLFFTDSLFSAPPGRGCHRNTLSYYGPQDSYLLAHSRRHVPGTVTVLPGEPTQPEPPPLPPLAREYAAPPRPEDARIRFELGGGVVQPGSQISLGLSITSNFEFSGYQAALTFPSDLLSVDRVEFHLANGASGIDNDAGTLFLVSSQSRRRLGMEGERVRVATIHVTVKEAASAVNHVDLVFEPFEDRQRQYMNWIGIWTRRGQSTDEVPILAQVLPLTVVSGLLRIQAEPTVLGDVDLDYSLSLADAVTLLGELFQGRTEVVCPQAADFNDDGAVNLADAVGVLNLLFRGGRPAPARDVYCSLQ